MLTVKKLHEMAGVAPTAAEELLSIGTSTTFAAREELLRAGRICRQMFYLEAGIIRGYRRLEGKEITHHFYLPGWFTTDYTSWLTAQPGELTLETLTAGKLIAFEKEALLKCYARHHSLERLGRIIAENAYRHTSDRNVLLQTLRLKDRYLQFLLRHPEVAKMVPQKHIASYLGVAEQSLSRIRIGLEEGE